MEERDTSLFAGNRVETFHAFQQRKNGKRGRPKKNEAYFHYVVKLQKQSETNEMK